MAKVILHIDLNYFFVRCEEIKDPKLEGKPVAIGHDGRGGIISTCSYKAREFGVRSGMPTFKAKQLCPNLILIRGSYEYYQKKSDEFFTFLRKYSKIIEPASIDECYVDITKEIKNVDNPMEFISSIQTNLFNETKLMCSIGVSTTKFLAKMGSDLKKPMGITVIHKKDIPNLLFPLKIEDFYGIGKKTSPKLREMGINTIGDLAKKINEDDSEMKEFLGKMYYAVKDRINGSSDDIVNTEERDPKSISHSHTLLKDTNDPTEIYEAIKIASKEVSKHAKEVNKIGTTVQLILKDNDFKNFVRSAKLKETTNDFALIYAKAISIYENNFENNEDKMFRLVGVGLQNLEEPAKRNNQMSIFDNYEEIKEECATNLLIQDINRKMKGSILKTAREVLEENRWK
ncbi:MAG: DNA polymerase IV [Bacilli bacterium]|nr:DNA polymerase IV [Bacilli bacterium]